MSFIPEEVLDEVGRELAGGAPPSLLRRFAELSIRRGVLDAELEVVRKEIAGIEPQLLESFADQGIQNCNILGQCIYVRSDLYVSKKADKDGVTTDDVCKALAKCGLGYMVKDGYSAASLKSKVAEWRKEGVEIPETLATLLNVGETCRLAARKA
ncbi:MAG: hypothetical protein ACREQ5_02650 [Candidatus Dormibacteria bacterium]